jgi:hypothetical protein
LWLVSQRRLFYQISAIFQLETIVNVKKLKVEPLCFGVNLYSESISNVEIEQKMNQTRAV